MQINKMLSAVAVGLNILTAASAAVHERAADSAVVIVHEFAALSTSTAFSTSEVTVWACASTATDCPEDSSTSLVSIVTAVIPVSTTICPLTVTSVTTSGVPGTGTNSGPLSTVTLTSSADTVYTTATLSASSAVSSVSSVGSVSGPSSAPVASGSIGSSQVTLHSTVTSMATVTVPGTAATTPLSGQSSTLVNATEASTSGTNILTPYQPSGAATTLSSTEVSPVGSTAYGTGSVTPSTNGTLATPTLSSPTESVVPFTGAAVGMDYERIMVCMVVAVGSAVLLF